MRRIAEYMACNIVVLFVLGAPIGWYTVASRTPPGATHDSNSTHAERKDVVVTGGLYPWTDVEHVNHSPILKGKAGWLNVPMWAVRILIYFGIWIFLAYYFRNLSLKQDVTGDPQLSVQRESYSAPGILIFAITTTLAAIDMIMSLNPHWFSTMFGVYFFAGGSGAFFATVILTLMTLQRFGRLQGIVTVEHYHDLGKFLWGFVFFWGYVAFSQYMLIWYANIPEETEWFRDRQYVGHTDAFSPWMKVGLVLLFIHILIPFPGFISRRMKRNLPALAFWAIWVLVAHAVDMYWLVMPEYSKKLFLAGNENANSTAVPDDRHSHLRGDRRGAGLELHSAGDGKAACCGKRSPLRRLGRVPELLDFPGGGDPRWRTPKMGWTSRKGSVRRRSTPGRFRSS